MPRPSPQSPFERPPQPPRRTWLRPQVGSLTAILAAVTVAVAGCSGTSEAAENPSDGKPRHGGTIVYAHDQEPPCLWGGWVQQAYLSRQVLDSLVSQVDDGVIVPWLATEWEVSDDQTTWTFTLKDGITFTDGTPLDAEAVKRNFDFWIKEQGNGTVLAYLGPYYQESRALSDNVFQLRLSEPYYPLLSALSQAYFGIQSPAALERSAEENCVEPIGSGPFIVEEWQRGSHVSFVKNTEYASAPANALHQGPAYVDRIEWRFVHDPVARYSSLGTGESDVIYDIPTPDWKSANERYEVQQYITPGHPVTLDLNTQAGPFADVRVRQAFAYATDRQAAVTSAFNGVIPFEGNGAISQSTPGYSPEAARHYTPDLARAEELLDQAGWTERDESGYRVKDGHPLEVRVIYGAGSMVTAEGALVLQTIQEQVKAAGFTVLLAPRTRDQLSSGAYSNPESYDARVGYWTSPTAGVMLINYRQNLPDSPNPANLTLYNNPELESLILQANSEPDVDKRNEFYRQAQKIVAEEAVSIGLYTQTTSLAIGPNVRGVWLEHSQGEPVFHDAYLTTG